MPQQLIKLPAVKQQTALSRTSIYQKIKAGQFPKPLPLGPRAVAWLSSDIDAWIDARVAEAKGSR